VIVSVATSQVSLRYAFGRNPKVLQIAVLCTNAFENLRRSVMSHDWTFFPSAMTAHDLAVMREALRLADRSVIDDDQKERMASIIFRFYARGMTEVDQLAAAAVFLSSSRAFAWERARAAYPPQPVM
jgi:hypothetical protein